MIRMTTAAVLLLAGSALAQYEITIDVENPVLLPGESTTVTLLAGFDASRWAMAGVTTDFVTSVGSDGWRDAMRVAPMAGPGTSAGMPSATGYDGIIVGQLNFHDIKADPTNPIAFWSVTYTAPFDAARPLEIELSTLTTKYDVYVHYDSSLSVSHLDDLVEGAATIRVIPAPPLALVLALGAFAARRRR